MFKTTVTDKDGPMSEEASPYKKVRLEEAVTDPQAKHSISALDEQWGSKKEKVRFQMASVMATGLLTLLIITIFCNETGIIAQIVVNLIVNEDASLETGIQQMTTFATTILPYVATPLGVAIGFFFKERQNE